MGEFQFVQLADTQLGVLRWWNEIAEKRRPAMTERLRARSLIPFDAELPPARAELTDFAIESGRFETAIEIVNHLEPKFVAVCGDIVNDLGDGPQREAALRIAGGLSPDIPMHWVPGNHDVCPDYLTPTPDGLQEFRSRFGDDYYSFEADETLFLVLNSETLNQPEHTPGEAERQLEFVRETLASERARNAQHVIAFMHTPLFTHDPETDDFGVMSLENRLRLLSILTDHEVEASFAGHLHLNRNAQARGMQMVASGAVGMPFWGEPGYRLVDVTDHGISHQYHALETPTAT